MFMNFTEAREWIETQKRFGEKLDLSKMRLACAKLNHPENAFRSVHVAGTNGKGSTVNYIKNILVDSGFKVGVYTSPYVVKFNERIEIGQEFISDADVVKYANFLYEFRNKLLDEDNEALTFFEILTLMAFLYFRDNEVDLAVIEVGLGGTLDATNVINPEVSCITNISYDHMKQLGNTLESIALNKLGIVKEGVPLVTTIENKDLFPLFSEVAAKNNARLKIIDLSLVSDIEVGEETTFKYRTEKYQLQLAGMHQVKNAVLAIEAIRILRLKDNLYISEQNIKNGLAMTSWPGRFEIFEHQIILDGAHNIGAVLSLKKALIDIFPGRYIKCLFCMMKDKDHEKVIQELDNIVDEFHFAEIEYPRRADAQTLYDESHHHRKFLHHDAKTTFLELRDGLKQNEILLVTGSLYLVSDIRALIVK